MPEELVVNEIYLSLQGESTFAGLPCIFVRLTACNLRCSYCDSAYAFTEGEKKSLEKVMAEVHRLAQPFRLATAVAADVRRLQSSTPHSALCTPHLSEPPHVGCYKVPLVELTGGEPLLQKTSLPLM